MSVAVTTAVLRSSIQPASAKLVALVMAYHYNDGRRSAWPSVGTLASECSMTPRHVQRVLADLKAIGVLVVVHPAKGGNRFSGTNHYGFDLVRLATLASNRGPGTPDECVRGDTLVMGACPDASGDTESQPPTPKACTPDTRGLHPRHPRRAPPTGASPKRDERKPTASSSSKAPAAPDSADGRSADTGNTCASGKVVQMSFSRQQPAFEEEAVRLRNLALVVAQDPQSWANDAALLSDVGVRFGLGPLADELRHGGDRLARLPYLRRVFEARAMAIIELKAAKRRKGKQAGLPQAKAASGTRGAP